MGAGRGVAGPRPPRADRNPARERAHAGDPAVLSRAHGDPQGAAGAGRAAAAASTSGRCWSGCAGSRGRAAGGRAAVSGVDRAGRRRRARAWPALAKPLAVDELIGLAVELARAVAGMHRRGVMHRDITPANIVRLRRRRPVPGGLRAGDVVGRDAPGVHPPQPRSWGRWRTWRRSRPGAPAGRWTSAPTCTRWARRCTSWPPVRRRSATGDPLRLTHDHLARVPVPPAEVNPAVPGPLSEIIMHLLEKEPDNRYQTAEGLVHDLERLRDGATRTRPGALRVGERRRAAAAAAAVAAGGPRRRGGGAGGGVRGRAGRPVPGGAGRRRAGGGQDGAGRPAAAGGDRQRRLVRGRQVRPVPAGSGVRRGPSGVPRAGSAAAGRAGGRAGRGPRADPGGRSGRTRACRPRWSRSSRRCWGCRPIPGIR